jgi:hypothetical protein
VKNEGGDFLPVGIFVIYMIVSLAAILGYRFLFPAERPPLPIFSLSWGLTGGILEGIRWFPALVFSALLLPFGLRKQAPIEFPPFSPYFLEILRPSIVTAIIASTVYGLLFFLALPIAQNHELKLRSQGQLFTLAQNRAEGHADRGEWFEAIQFLTVCEEIWPESPEIEHLGVGISLGYDEYLMPRSDFPVNERMDIQRESPASIPPEGVGPVDAREALGLAERALEEKRYYDAQWLASLSERLARPGSAGQARAAALSSRAWNAAAALSPSAREAEAHSLYRLKREGYEAMVGGDWIRAYYTFNELSHRGPEDPDTVNFLARCKEELGKIAFFTDELELGIGEILMGAVFSFPGRYEGRVVVQCSSLTAFPGFAYALGLELMAFNPLGELTSHVEAPYAKFLPVRVNERDSLVVLMRALDRQDKNTQWGPHWAGSQRSEIGDDQMILDIPFEDFLLITRSSRGTALLFMGELFRAAERLGNYGFIPQVFQAEILRRLSDSVLILSLTIFALLIGWRFRAKKHLRFIGFPMLVGLPLIANGVVYGYRHIFTALEIGMILSLGFPLAVFISMASGLILFMLALVFLAAQHG